MPDPREDARRERGTRAATRAAAARLDGAQVLEHNPPCRLQSSRLAAAALGTPAGAMEPVRQVVRRIEFYEARELLYRLVKQIAE